MEGNEERRERVPEIKEMLNCGKIEEIFNIAKKDDLYFKLVLIAQFEIGYEYGVMYGEDGLKGPFDAKRINE